MAAATLAELDEIIDANADYAEVGSAAKARAYASAMRRKLNLIIQSGGQGQSQITLPVETLKQLLAEATQWLAVNGSASSNDASGGVTHFNMGDFRS